MAPALYNALLSSIVIAHGIAAWPAFVAALKLDNVFSLWILAVLANVAYSAVYIADVFIQLSGFRAQRRVWRRVLLVVGFAFAAVLTHLFSGGLFPEPRPS